MTSTPKKVVGVMVRQALIGIRRFVRRISSGKTAVIAALALSLASPAMANPKYAGIVVDAKTGKVLYEENADSPRFPASLTKMMTLYLTFEALDAGKVTKNTRITFSKNAAAEPPTKLGVGAGNSITVEQAILALVTKSANDAATALAEHLGGSEANFAAMMTAKARQLGMTRTVFRNAHGLPNDAQKTTARDMARLGIALREHFPHHYHYFSTREFRFGKHRIGNHNRLLGAVKGVDGIKTGFTRAAGYNLVSSVQTDGRSIVAVVMGGSSARARDQQMANLISRYLPKASTGRDQQLIARGPVVIQPSAQVASAAAHSLPKIAPIPAGRPSEVLPVTAYAQEQAKADEDMLARIVAQDVVRVAAVTEAKATDGVDPVHTASAPAQVSSQPTSSASGQWVIQVASMPTKSEALRFLEEMKERVGGELAHANPFTEVFQHKGKTFHRARFGGFEDKVSAWSACENLKKQKIQCFATMAN